MEFYIVWPSFWWNIAFAIACVVFILVFISNKTRENDKLGANVGRILLNKYLWLGLCLLSFLACFVLTLLGLQYGINDDVKANIDIGLVQVLYIVLGIMFPVFMAAYAADLRKTKLECGFIFAAGNSFIGLMFVVCNAFSYMWVALGFLIFDILGAGVANYIDKE